MPINVKSLSILDTAARDLLLQAQAASRRGRAGLRGFRGGAAVRAPGGITHIGSTFAAPQGEVMICAEVAAVAVAWSAGEVPAEIAVVAGTNDPEGGLAAPCGSCRALLDSLARTLGQEIVVYVADLGLGRIILTTSGELLPLAAQSGQTSGTD